MSCSLDGFGVGVGFFKLFDELFFEFEGFFCEFVDELVSDIDDVCEVLVGFFDDYEFFRRDIFSEKRSSKFCLGRRQLG